MSKTLGRYHSLGGRGIAYIIVLSIIFAATTTAIVVYASYNNHRQQVNLSLKAIQSSTIPSLTTSVWNFDTPHINLILKNLISLPYISYARVIDNRGDSYSEGVITESKHIKQVKLPLIYHLAGPNTYQVGRLSLGVNYHQAANGLLAQAAEELISQILVILLMAGAILLGLHYAVSRNLKTLAEYAESLSMKNLRAPPMLSRLFRPKPPDEFDIVTGALGKMSSRLIREFNALEVAKERNRKLSKAVEEGPAGVIIADRKGIIEYVNPAFELITGYSTEKVLGNPNVGQEIGVIPLLPGQLSSTDLPTFLSSKGEWAGELVARREDGSSYWLHLSLSGIHGAEGVLTHVLVVLEDITVLKESEKRILKQQNYDTITGLPNRLLGYDRFGQYMEFAARTNKRLALLMIDIDNFSNIHATYSIQDVDELLREVVERIRKVVKSETIARFSDDQFLITLYNLKYDIDAELVAHQILEAFSQPFNEKDIEVILNASIGIAIFPDHGSTPDTLIRNASAALQDARNNRQRKFSFYDVGTGNKTQRYIQLNNDLHRAISRNELSVYVQPIVSCDDESYCGAEALVRWRHKELGMVSPMEFIPLAEKNQLIHEIGAWVLDTALRHLSSLKTENENFWLSVNVSPYQFLQKDFVYLVTSSLGRYKLSAKNLKLEVTEQVLLGDNDYAQNAFKDLHDLGVGLSLDDFGTGYSALSYLNKFQFNSLKIDKSFIDKIGVEEKGTNLVVAMIELAHRLGLTVVAEGVETQMQVELLRDLRCDCLQGYFFAKPGPIEEFTV